MSDEPKPVAERSYRIGDVGAGARVAQGENISWAEGLAALPDGHALAGQFASLLERIAKDPSLDDDTRELARAKTQAVSRSVIASTGRSRRSTSTRRSPRPPPG